MLVPQIYILLSVITHESEPGLFSIYLEGTVKWGLRRRNIVKKISSIQVRMMNKEQE